MSELVDQLRAEFQDEEYRHSYAEECVNTMIANRICTFMRPSFHTSRMFILNKSDFFR